MFIFERMVQNRIMFSRRAIGRGFCGGQRKWLPVAIESRCPSAKNNVATQAVIVRLASRQNTSGSANLNDSAGMKLADSIGPPPTP